MSEPGSALPPLRVCLLSGGASRRMGQDKALLPHPEGGCWLERSLRLLAALQVPITLLSRHPEHLERARRWAELAAAPEPAAAAPAGPDLPPLEALAEPPPWQGPLLALGRLARRYPNERLLLCPVDMPWLTLEALQMLRRAVDAEPHGLLLAHDGERPQPLLMALPLAPALRQDLQTVLETGERRLQGWLVRHPHRELRLNPQALRNVNRPEEWQPAMNGMGLVWERECLEHRTGAGHPESPRRLEAIRAGLERAGLWARCQRLRARPITREELLRCHSAAYLELVERELRQGRPQLSTGDTPLSEGSERAAALAAGGALTAVEAVMGGRVKRAFVALRPPGHHATTDRGMGFCLFNNVALAARHAQAVCGAERVLILDWDVHHGNGTQEIFWRDPSVFYCSLHQMPLYPGSGCAEERGEGAGAGATLNLPLPPGSGGDAMLQALHRQLEPLLERFRPSLVLLSAGFDAMAGDPLADLRLSAADVTNLTELALTYAERYANGRLVSLLEGGYNLNNLAQAAVAHVGALLAGPSTSATQHHHRDGG